MLGHECLSGVSVPVSGFSDTDFGKTYVLYNMPGKHRASHFPAPYRGRIEGYRAFESCDSMASGPEPGGKLFRSMSDGAMRAFVLKEDRFSSEDPPAGQVPK